MNLASLPVISDIIRKANLSRPEDGIKVAHALLRGQVPPPPKKEPQE